MNLPKAPALKVCSKCQVEKSVNEFFKDKSGKNGLRASCRACNKRYREENAEKIKDRNKAYLIANSEKIKASKKAYYIANPERIKAWHKAYYIINSEKIIAYNKDYRDAHREAIHKSQKLYSKTVKGKTSGQKKSHKRRVLKIGATIEQFSPIEIFQRDKYICQLCGIKTRPDYKNTNNKYPHLDHIIPLSKGGEHSVKNTQCLCRRCNIAKHNSENFGDQLRLF